MSNTETAQSYDEESLQKRAHEIFHEDQEAVWRRTDHMFAYLMLMQWLVSVFVALWVSPLTWSGVSSNVHVHVWTAVVLGGLITALPVTLGFLEPGRKVTRFSIGVAQILMSCLLIHLTGGRIETHFHVFCSLAFLGLYRDWRVLILPTIIVAADHLVRGMVWPQSVYGITSIEPWRWLEHSGWVLFEVAVLVFSSVKGTQELLVNAVNRARLEQTNALVEAAVIKRTAELQEARDQALAASKVKSQFVANMSHEVRTPMSGIMGMTELLIAEETDPNKKAQLKMLFSTAESLLTILNDILDFSKLEAGKLALENMPLSLAMLTEEATHFMMPKADLKKLTIRTHCAPDLPQIVYGDAVRLRQILLNLLSNAIKFTSSGGIVVRVNMLEVSGNTGIARFEIEDTGVGLNPDQQSRLFQAFEQLDNSSTRRHSGTGLGLSICRKLLELMGGAIGVESEAGRGSTFWFNLPVQLEGSCPTEPPVRTPGDGVIYLPAPDNGASTILVVEDTETLLIILKIQLAKLGYGYEVARDGKEAVAIYLSKKIDMILMDCQMPILDGYDATEAIRKIEENTGKHIPIIAMTASAMVGDRENCLAAGMDDYIGKPFTFPELRLIIEKWLPESAKTRSQV